MLGKLFIAIACAAASVCAWPATVSALTPESPEVKAAVAKGLKYLEVNHAGEPRLGGVALTGLAFVKTESSNHALVKSSVTKIAAALNKNDEELNGPEQIYHLGLMLIFLASHDGVANRPQIDNILGRLQTKQKGHGGWGYPNQETGDTSMTQYGVLGMWEAYRVGASPSLQSWERVCNWLLRTQDPSGAFGYQGAESMNGPLVPQEGVRPSMAAAGLGSLYVCADQFGLNQTKPANAKNVPSALKEVKRDTREKQRPTGVDLQRMRASMQLGNGWFAKNFTAKAADWTNYYYYAFERYQSFRETVEHITDKEPAWYTQIANELIKAQNADGSWEAQAGAVPDTSFAILFLVRSTKKSIQQALGAGTLVGGRGLPTDASKLQMRGGSIVRKPLAGPASQLLSVMENPDSPEFLAAVEGLAEVKLEPDDAQLPQQLVRLKKLAGGASPEARMVAMRLLAKTRDLDNAPLLIYSLSDPHLGVVKEARDALRFMSRKFDTLGPEIPEGTYDLASFEADRRKAIEQWKTWYLSVRPDHVFSE